MKQNLQLRFKDEIALTLGELLDGIEAEIGDNPAWPMVRRRVLRSLGDKGLLGRIVRLLAEPAGSMHLSRWEDER